MINANTSLILIALLTFNWQMPLPVNFVMALSSPPTSWWWWWWFGKCTKVSTAPWVKAFYALFSRPNIKFGQCFLQANTWVRKNFLCWRAVLLTVTGVNQESLVCQHVLVHMHCNLIFLMMHQDSFLCPPSSPTIIAWNQVPAALSTLTWFEGI